MFSSSSLFLCMQCVFFSLFLRKLFYNCWFKAISLGCYFVYFFHVFCGWDSWSFLNQSFYSFIKFGNCSIIILQIYFLSPALYSFQVCCLKFSHSSQKALFVTREKCGWSFSIASGIGVIGVPLE